MPQMKRSSAILSLLFIFSTQALGQSSAANQEASNSDYNLALPTHPGQLRWHADGFKVIETSAKSRGQEIGLRGKDASGRLTFLGFLFLVPEEAPLTSAKCRDSTIKDENKNSTLKILPISQTEGSENIPVALVTYSTKGSDGKTWYMVRGFVATGNICGDLEFYSESSITAEDADLKKIFETYHFDPNYIAQFKDVLLYAQILYLHQMYKAAAPIFEQALLKLPDDREQQTMRRATTDQAGMSYGMSGDIPKARAIFEAAIAKDPDYPLYYYNLACADAEEKKLTDARVHLQEAFARKGNMIPGENFPDPTKDESFLPYKKNKDFWTFLQGLR
jgi:tetratricopeptide (TPR) repeat protein